MDVAVLADIHGNYKALKTCVRYALDKGIRNFWFLGDYLGEFAFPQRTMKLLYELQSTCECIFIKGNKEKYWTDYRKEGKDKKSSKNRKNRWKEYDSTTGSLYYIYHNITERDLDFFEGMEISQVVQPEDMEPVTLCHGSPRRVNEGMNPDSQNTFEILEQCDTQLLLCAHTHIQRKTEYEGKTVLNPGSVGAPYHSCGKAQFLILHGDKGFWKEAFISLDYDAEEEIRNLYAARLDKRAPYWCRVTIQFLRTGKWDHGLVLEKAMELCREETGECIWPEIPEDCWKKAYEAYFGTEELMGVSCSSCPEREDFPVPLEIRTIYESPWMNLYADRVKMPDGSVIGSYHRVHIPRESVCVAVINEKDEILLIRSKRYTTGRMEWELPAGRIEEGECAESAAARECMEETGCRIRELQYLCSQNPSNGISDILIHYYDARVESEGSSFDRNEVQGRRWVSKKEAALMLQNNGSRCGVSMFGLLYVLQFGK